MGTAIISGFFCATQVGLIIFKALGIISWSWWLVLLPVWAVLVVLVIAVILLVILYSRQDGGWFN